MQLVGELFGEKNTRSIKRYADQALLAKVVKKGLCFQEDKGDESEDDDMTVDAGEQLAALAHTAVALQLRHEERVASGLQATASSSHGTDLTTPCQMICHQA